MDKIKVIAYYLPQFHPIPENDVWWGKGFTEWTNVGKAKSLFPGHLQPRVPSELGYYDLRVPEVREQQAALAKEYGVDGFAYWHYWFGNGKQLLERPFNEVLKKGKPDFPFCLSWANETWQGFYHGLKSRQTLIEQTYPGNDDNAKHFYNVLPALKDNRYITIDGKPLFIVYRPFNLPNPKDFIMQWRELASQNGLPGICFVGITDSDEKIDEILNMGFDFVNLNGMNRYLLHRKSFKYALKSKIYKMIYGCKNVGFYEDAMKYFINDNAKRKDVLPTIIPNWDHSPRTNKEGYILHGSTPDLFRKHLNVVKESVRGKDNVNNIVFIKSWNEWGEGNFMEPDIIFGRKYLETFKEVMREMKDI